MVEIDENDVTDQLEYQDIQVQDQLCGEDMGHLRQKQITIIMNHSDENIMLKFMDNLMESSTDMSWGINDLKIYIYCDGYVVGNMCISQQEYDKCSKLVS